MFAPSLVTADRSLALARGALLSTARWPATRDELVAHAARSAAPLQLLEELFMLPDDEARYESLIGPASSRTRLPTDPPDLDTPGVPSPAAAAARPRVIIAEDHTLVREGLRMLLEGELDIVETVEDGRALVAAAERHKPDVILLDISMPLLNGLDAARQLAQVSPASKLLFVTMHADPAYVRRAFNAGASGYVVKSSASSELTAAIAAILAGQRYISPLPGVDLADLLSGEAPPESGEPSEVLTPRQREILQLVAEGRTAREIAVVLAISRKTVEFHKASIMRLLRLRTTAELTRYAMARGIITSS